MFILSSQEEFRLQTCLYVSCVPAPAMRVPHMACYKPVILETDLLPFITIKCFALFLLSTRSITQLHVSFPQ